MVPLKGDYHADEQADDVRVIGDRLYEGVLFTEKFLMNASASSRTKKWSLHSVGTASP